MRKWCEKKKLLWLSVVIINHVHLDWHRARKKSSGTFCSKYTRRGKHEIVVDRCNIETSDEIIRASLNQNLLRKHRTRRRRKQNWTRRMIIRYFYAVEITDFLEQSSKFIISQLSLRILCLAANESLPSDLDSPGDCAMTHRMWRKDDNIRLHIFPFFQSLSFISTEYRRVSFDRVDLIPRHFCH